MSSSPAHIAIIMDGNGRWAKAKGLPRTAGHKKGADTTRAIITEAKKLGIKYLTIYAFSAENWQRPEKEVSFLMDLLKIQMREQIKDLHKNGVKLTIIGDKARLKEDVRDAINDAEKLTENNSDLFLQVALNYGGRQEILRAVEIANGNADLFKAALYTNNVPDPDLLIRTGGEKRISNFLLWQIAYAELYFTDKLWPEFNGDDLKAAIADFGARERRYGKADE